MWKHECAGADLFAVLVTQIPSDLSLRAGQWTCIRTFRNLQEDLSTSEQYFEKFQEYNLRR